ncbi:hypothetical protein RUMCAL_01133 [Ruminococcus callidus ATCC 27760]|uniref:Uncharacterized protein n=1 Tax=Ruminococcus callidus ATCC 27760 TaxID=411473 RepID=U2KD85_9FIRM|nr:hypothetical protein RUMCAL_01133 [Ruminococcus callidus ATCC 27760]
MFPLLTFYFSAKGTAVTADGAKRSFYANKCLPSAITFFLIHL